MKVKELIEKLKAFNQEAEVKLIENNVCVDNINISWGFKDGSSKSNCEEVYFERCCNWNEKEN